MDKHSFSPQRSRATTKPKVVCPQIAFYRCDKCQTIVQLVESGDDMQLTCCNTFMHRLQEKEAGGVSLKVDIDYKIMGGYNKNVVEVFWREKDEDTVVKWICLKTFTGNQIKYVTEHQKKSFVFALADEDAYVYCDEDPCIECTFRCKRGFEIYAYVQMVGLLKISIDRMHPNWQSN